MYIAKQRYLQDSLEKPKRTSFRFLVPDFHVCDLEQVSFSLFLSILICRNMISVISQVLFVSVEWSFKDIFLKYYMKVKGYKNGNYNFIITIIIKTREALWVEPGQS